MRFYKSNKRRITIILWVLGLIFILSGCKKEITQSKHTYIDDKFTPVYGDKIFTMEEIIELSKLAYSIGYEDLVNYAYKELLSTADENSPFHNNYYAFPIDSRNGEYQLEVSIPKGTKELDVLNIVRKATREHRDIRRFNIEEFLVTYENITDYLSVKLPNNSEFGTFHYYLNGNSSGNPIFIGGVEVGAFERSFGSFYGDTPEEWSLDSLYWQSYPNVTGLKELQLSDNSFKGFLFTADHPSNVKHHFVNFVKDGSGWLYTLRLDAKFFSQEDTIKIAEAVSFHKNSFSAPAPDYGS